MRLSDFALRFQGNLGILELMRDLGEALAAGEENLAMLGGGNPSHIPAVERRFAERTRDLLADEQAFGRFIGNYSPPRGDPAFLEALARLLRERCGWDVGPENLVLTAGSQAAFFMLFNALAGRMPDGSRRRILLPLLPEYVGYADLGLTPEMFRAERPAIECIGEHEFKYHVDFETLEVGGDVGAICLSRPGNPTANVLGEAELARLHALALEHDLPLIVDGAYGPPFPGIVFGQAAPFWGPNVVVCLSLSKLGLPAARTGIVVGPPELTALLARMNAVLQLAPSGMGAALALELVRSGEILDLVERLVQPYYRERLEQALALVHEAFADLPCRVHRPEGGIFLWLWFPGLPIDSAELYRRLRERGVILVPGEYFFPGLREPWPHSHECVRLTYTQPLDVVRRGVFALAEEVRRAHDAGTSAGARRSGP